MSILPNPFSFTGCADHCLVEAAAASPILTGTVDAAAEPIAESSMTEGGQEAPADANMGSASAGLLDGETYREVIVDMDALYDAIVPPEPPVFLRNPSQNFIKALLELAR